MNDARKKFQRWRYAITTIGSIMLVLQLCLVLINALAIVDQVETGSWAMLGAGVVTMWIQIPLAVVGIVIAVPLVIESGFGRFGAGIPLLIFSIAMLNWKTAFVLGRWLAGLFGYHT